MDTNVDIIKPAYYGYRDTESLEFGWNADFLASVRARVFDWFTDWNGVLSLRITETIFFHNTYIGQIWGYYDFNVWITPWSRIIKWEFDAASYRLLFA